MRKMSKISMGLLFFVLINSIVLADQRIEQVKLSTHSFEGNKERIAFYFTDTLTDNLYLEVYEFHYIMLPELAPDEDTWPHEKQMSHMEDVLAGKAEAYQPRLSEKKVRDILQRSPKEEINLSSMDNKIYYTDWKATHGRIFFRLRTDKDYFDDKIYTMRVHCQHIDMRAVEKLKEQIQAIRLPLEHKNRSFATDLYDDLYTTFIQGHSLSFMLQHHERETGDLDTLFTKLKGSIDRSDFNQAKKLVVQIEQEIAEKEELFFKLSARKIGRVIEIGVEDNINEFSFYEDPIVEVYVKEYGQPTTEELMAKAHSAPMNHSQNDPSAHSRMLKPNKSLLTKDAIRLEISEKMFVGTVPEEWKAISVVVFYGMDQNYYLTSHFNFD